MRLQIAMLAVLLAGCLGNTNASVDNREPSTDSGPALNVPVDLSFWDQWAIHNCSTAGVSLAVPLDYLDELLPKGFTAQPLEEATERFLSAETYYGLTEGVAAVGMGQVIVVTHECLDANIHDAPRKDVLVWITLNRPSAAANLDPAALDVYIYGHGSMGETLDRMQSIGAEMFADDIRLGELSGDGALGYSSTGTAFSGTNQVFDVTFDSAVFERPVWGSHRMWRVIDDGLLMGEFGYHAGGVPTYLTLDVACEFAPGSPPAIATQVTACDPMSTPGAFGVLQRGHEHHHLDMVYDDDWSGGPITLPTGMRHH